MKTKSKANSSRDDISAVMNEIQQSFQNLKTLTNGKCITVASIGAFDEDGECLDGFYYHDGSYDECLTESQRLLGHIIEH